MNPPTHVVKRDHRIVDFDSSKIREAVKKAMIATHSLDERSLELAVQRVLSALSDKYGSDKTPNVEEIQNVVEQILIQLNLYPVAKAYVVYRREREQLRDEKKQIIEKDSVDEVDKSLSLNALRLLASRYLLRDENGRIFESPKQLFQRVASLIIISDILHDPKVFDKDGDQSKWPVEKFDPSSLEGKLPFGMISAKQFEVTWNRHHLERMHHLWREMNDEGKMRLSWQQLIEGLRKGDFEHHYPSYREYYSLMVEKKFLPNSPTLFNAGAQLGQLSACFVLPIGDSMESIMQSAEQAALIFKSGGGIGINYSPLRPEGDRVASTAGTASGPVSFMRIIDTVTDVVKQGGKRRGANMGILDISHPDIEKFVRSKHETKQFENFNISVLIPREFWDYHKSGRPWPLKNPRDGEVWKEVDPKQLFQDVSRMAWETADPGALFLDNINKDNPLREHWGDIKCVNPCVTSDTWIMTADGPLQVRDLINTPFAAIVNGEEWNGSREGFFSTGFKPVFKLSTKEGFQIRLTRNHMLRRVMKSSRNRLTTEWVQAGDLKPRDMIVVNDHRGTTGWSGKHTENEGYLMGLLLGDGTLKTDKAVLRSWGEDEGARAVRKLAYTYAKEMPHRSDFVGWMKIPGTSEYRMATAHLKAMAIEMGLRPGAKRLNERLEQASSDFCQGMLRGFFDADGSIQGTQTKGVSARLAQSDLPTLRAAQRLLLRFGIFSKIYVNRRIEGYTEMPDGRGGKKLYRHKAQHELVISNESLRAFQNRIGFADIVKRKRLEQALSSYKRRINTENFVATVSQLIPDGEEEVYDAHVKGINAFDANGFVVHNCGEEPMYPYESCNLGSLNVYAFVKHENGKPSTDWSGLEKAVSIATRFLDNVVDLNNFPVADIQKVSKSTRRIGLGIMGLADLLYALQIPYNTEEGFALMSKIVEFLSYHSIKTSIQLSKQRGPFPLFNKSSYSKGKLPFEGFHHKEWWTLDWESVAEEVRKNGTRNSHNMTIAPTGSISMVAETSSGLEPEFALVFEKHVTMGSFYYVDPEFEKQINADLLIKKTLLKRISDNGGSLQGLDNIPERLKQIFLVAYDVPWWDHIRAQYEMQKWISAAVSKTINMPSWASVEDVEDAYLFAYKLGLKGVTIYRDTSKGEQVLRTPTQRLNRYLVVAPNKTVEMMSEHGLRPLKQTGPDTDPIREPSRIHGSPEKSGVEFAKCPNCGSPNLAFQEACYKCLECSWSTCIIG